MRKAFALALACAVVMASAASAAVMRHGQFTLRQAYDAAVRSEREFGLGGQVGPCYWQDRHDAACPVVYHATIIDGLPPATIESTDVVTRSGPCPAGHLIHVGGLTEAVGQNTGNCFTGPLVVLSGA